MAPALTELQPYLSEEWLVFYTDESSVCMDVVGWLGGFSGLLPAA